MEVNSRGLLRLIGKTNLPSGMAGILELRSTVGSFTGRDSVVVAKGGFESKWFSANYSPLSPGVYCFCFLTPSPGSQPERVVQVIGKNGENLRGPLVMDQQSENIVKYENSFTLK